MANNRRDPQREALWRRLLAKHASSGLSVQEFCRREKLAKSAFYAWRRTICERDSETTESGEFVPAVVLDRRQDDMSILLQLASGDTLKLPESITAERLAELVHALERRTEP